MSGGTSGGREARAADPRADMEALAKRILGFATADETRVVLRDGWTGHTRFAGGEITTSGSAEDRTVTVVSTVGRRRAQASTNVMDDASLRRTVDLAERLARLAPEDPELMPELGPQQYAAVAAYDARTAELTAARRAEAVEGLLAAARGVDPKQELFVAGFLEATAAHAQAVATSRGLFAFHAGTDVGISTTVRTPDGTGSGWAADGAREWGRLDLPALGRRAAAKAVASRNPVAIEPGRYNRDPRAAGRVGDMVPLLLGALNARTAEEGRSPFSRRGPGVPAGATLVGETIAERARHLYSDPADPELRGQPFDGDGLPLGRRVWIENGVLGTWPTRATGRAGAAAGERGRRRRGGGFGDGGGTTLKMVGGTQSLEELVAGTARGVLVTRSWYIRPLDARSASYTGLTRDGTFLVENGKITRAIKNFRWNESPLTMLGRIEAIGRAERIGAGQVMPSLKVRDFNFASISEAV
jgi:predicted Zn-dependent protease